MDQQEVKNDFSIYNEARTIIQNAIEISYSCIGNSLEERACGVIEALPRGEKVLARYGLDGRWCTEHKKPTLRAIVKDYILGDLKIDQAALRKLAPQLWEAFILARAMETEEQTPVTEALVPTRTYLIRSDKALAVAGLVDFKLELPGNVPITARDWVMIDVMTEAAMRWTKGPMQDAVSFSDDDFWRWTGLKSLHVNEIRELFLRVLDLKIVAPCKTEYDEKEEVWKQTTYYGHVFSAGKIVAYGKLLGRKGKVVDNRSTKHVYHFFSTENYGHLIVNLALGKALRLDKILYELPDGSQIIYRRFAPFKYVPEGSFLSYDHVARLLGWDPAGSKQLCVYRLKRMKAFLDELKRAGLIRWQIKDRSRRGRDVVFWLRQPGKDKTAEEMPLSA